MRPGSPFSKVKVATYSISTMQVVQASSSSLPSTASTSTASSSAAPS
jgi:hypothetical protein